MIKQTRVTTTFGKIGFFKNLNSHLGTQLNVPYVKSGCHLTEILTLGSFEGKKKKNKVV